MTPTHRMLDHELAAARRAFDATPDGQPPVRCAAHLARALAMAPEHPEALALLERCLELVDAPGELAVHGEPVAQLFDCWLLARGGELARALDLLLWMLDAIPTLPVVGVAAGWLAALPVADQPRSRLGWLLARVARRLPDVARHREADLEALRALRPLLDAIVEHAGDDATLLSITAIIYRKMRDHDRALELARRVAPDVPPYDAAIGLANVYRLTRDTDAALAALADAEAADPDAGIIRRDRALTLADGERFAEAAAAFDALLAEHPDAGAYAVAAAWSRRRAGCPKPELDAHFDDLFAVVPPDADVDTLWRLAYEPWTGFLPDPGDAIVAAMRQVEPDNDAVATTSTAPEAPSALWAARLHTTDDLSIASLEPREPSAHAVAATGLGLFIVDEVEQPPRGDAPAAWHLTRLEPAWPAPAPEVRDAVTALAAEPIYDLAHWREQARACADALGDLPVESVIGCAAHVGAPPENTGFTAWSWLQRMQVATALVVARRPGGPELLGRLVLGPHDWIISCAAVALTELALDEPSWLPTVRAVLWARLDGIGAGWCGFERAVRTQARRLPGWTSWQRTALEARDTETEDDDGRPEPPSAGAQGTPPDDAPPPACAASPDPAVRELAGRIAARFADVLADDDLRRLEPAPLDEPLIAGLDDATPADLDAALATFAEALPGLDDPYQASRLALLCGVLVERGASAAIVGRALADRLRLDARLVARFLDRVDTPPPDADAIWSFADAHPAAVRAWLGARWLNMAVMTTLCRDGGARVHARTLGGLRDDLRVVHPHLANGWYVYELLRLTDDFELVALAPTTGQGWRVRADGVRNVEHLCCLIEGELFDGAVDASLFAVARAETWQVPEHPSRRKLTWHPWYAVDALGVASQDAPILLDGAAAPTDVATVEGTTVIVAQPASIELHWNPRRLTGLHQAHQPRVDVRSAMSREEVAGWMARLTAVE